jgi:hypothetical protein
LQRVWQRRRVSQQHPSLASLQSSHSNQPEKIVANTLAMKRTKNIMGKILGKYLRPRLQNLHHALVSHDGGDKLLNCGRSN